MKARHAILVALAVAVTLTAVAAAGPHAAKQRVAIDMKIYPQGKFVLRPSQAGALKQDSGKISSNWTDIPGRTVMRDGQEVTIYDGAVTTLTGKLGTLTIRDRNEWVAVANENVRNGDFRPGVGIGTWKVVRGTGQYAGMVGNGRDAHVGLGDPWFARYEGLLTVR
jgi:hypothetical protein